MSGVFGNVTPIQVPDFAQTAQRAQGFQANRLAMLVQQRQMDEADQRQQFLAQNAQGFASPDASKRMNLLAMMAQVPGLAQMALPQMGALRDRMELDGPLPAPMAGAPQGASAGGAGGVRVGAAIQVPAELDDADVLARTIIGEAGNQGEVGQRAVAAVVRNRMAQTGRGVRDVVLAPSQFEPWGARREELLRIPTNDPRYIAARRLAEETIAGRIEDPTGGATHFLNPDLQRQLGRQQPSWAPEGQGRRIGAHVFYTPGGGVRVGQGATVPASNGDTVPAQNRPPGAQPSAGADGIQRTPSGLVVVPGMDMGRIERAYRAGSGNPVAVAAIEQYQRALATHLQTVSMQRRGEAARPVEVADQTSPTGRRLVSPQEATGMPAPGPAPSDTQGFFDRFRELQNKPNRTAAEEEEMGVLRSRLGGERVIERGPAAFDNERGTTLAKEEAAVRRLGRESGRTLSRVGQIERDLERFTTGALSGARITVGQIAQTLGIPDAMLPPGTRRDEVASAENIRSQAMGLIQSMLGSGEFPTNNFSNADMMALQQANPSLANSPAGNRAIIGVMRAMAQRNLEVARAWDDWRRQNGSGSDSFDRFQLDRLPEITSRDVLAPVVNDAFPVNNPMQQGGAPAGVQADAPPAVQRPVSVATPEEARRLPPGTPIRLPDGTMGRVPGG